MIFRIKADGVVYFEVLHTFEEALSLASEKAKELESKYEHLYIAENKVSIIITDGQHQHYFVYSCAKFFAIMQKIMMVERKCPEYYKPIFMEIALRERLKDQREFEG